MIGNQVLNSLKWLGSARALGQVTTTAITIVVIRLLEPSDYGLMAMSSVFLGLIMLLNEMGLGSALVQQQDVSKREMEQVLGLLIVVNAGLYVFIFLTAPLIATFFSEPRVTPIVQVLAIRLPLGSLSVVQRSILQREMKFRARAMIDFTGLTSGSLATLTFALFGHGVWSLVYGSLIGSVVQVAGTYAASRVFLMPKFSVRGMRRQAVFGGFLTMDRILWYLYTQSDAIIVGRVIGDQALGFYHIAKRLASLPLDKLGGTINEVGFSAYSRVQNDMSALRSHYCKAAQAASFFGFPVCFGISATAPVAVPLILGPKWEQSILTMQLVSLVIPMRQLNVLNTPALLGIGRPDINVVNLIFALLIMPAAFLLGSRWGLHGVAIAWVLAYPVYFVIMLYRSLPVLGVSAARYFSSIWPQALAAAVMYFAVATSGAMLQQYDVATVVVLLLMVMSGMVVYFLSLMLLRRHLVSEMLTLVRRGF